MVIYVELSNIKGSISLILYNIISLRNHLAKLLGGGGSKFASIQSLFSQLKPRPHYFKTPMGYLLLYSNMI